VDWIGDFTTFGSPLSTLARAQAPFTELADWPTLDDYTAALRCVRTASGLTLSCVAHTQAPRRRPRVSPTLCDRYDGRIYFRGELPTRLRCWHDHFNYLSWRAFPLFKAAINAAQVHALVPLFEQNPTQMPGARTQAQDRLAMIDEGGILVVRERDGIEVRTAATRPDAQVLFGHALYEHVLLERALPVRGFPLRVESPINAAAYSDDWFAQVDVQLVCLLPTLLCTETAPSAIAWQPPQQRTSSPTLGGGH
jgi:Protein of unknown function (DUF3025)